MRPHMNVRLIAVTLILITVASQTRLRAADAPETVQRTVKLISTMSEGVNAQYIYVAPPEGGASVKLLVSGDAKKKYASLFTLRGELINVTVKAGGQATDMVTAIDKFDGPREMKSPKAHIFEGTDEKKVGLQTMTVAKLTRFGQTKEAAIPNRPVPGGKPAPDPVLIERLKNIKTGDVVEVELTPGSARGSFTLVDVDTFREPQVGEFVKLDTIKEGTRSIPAIVLTVLDEPQTIALPASSSARPNDAAAVALARKLRPGNYVRFTARDDAGHTTLRDLRIDGSMEPTYRGQYEFVSTFIRVHYYVYGADIEVYFYPRAGRPDDQLIEKGLRYALSNSSDANRVGLKPDQVDQFKKILEARLEAGDSDDLMVREKMKWSKAYKAWNAARDDAERAKIEEQMAFAAQDISGHWRKDIESKFTILKTLLDTTQLEEVRKLGKKSPGALE
ncbi:MAG: hypothetical protein JWN40_1519 [Phycisphaerales bacterium]|nr:hypothetical protein [Phycisphaerales bacterium]